jgi:hypothetical protein
MTIPVHFDSGRCSQPVFRPQWINAATKCRILSNEINGRRLSLAGRTPARCLPCNARVKDCMRLSFLSHPPRTSALNKSEDSPDQSALVVCRRTEALLCHPARACYNNHIRLSPCVSECERYSLFEQQTVVSVSHFLPFRAARAAGSMRPAARQGIGNDRK